MFSVQVPLAHRDLKSSNIVLKSREECVICDFGLALRLDLSRTADDFAYSGQFNLDFRKSEPKFLSPNSRSTMAEITRTTSLVMEAPGPCTTKLA
ncbi:unnamed protein product [Boreogadus saida]